MTEWQKRPPLQGDARIAATQARRDRARLAAAQAEILALKAQQVGVRAAVNKSLRARLGRLEHTPFRPALALARKLARHRHPQAVPPTAPAPASRGRALIIDDHWPLPDRDSGSVDICNLAEALSVLGFEVLLAAAREHDGAQPARDALQTRGIACLTPAEAPSVAAFLAQQGATLDLCVLCRVFCGGQFLESVLEHCIKARIVFNSIDLNFLREERKARLLGDPKLLEIAQAVRPREEYVIRHSDATILVSEAERDLLAATLPDCLAVTLPLARPMTPPKTPFAARAGIGFIGGFKHTPNIDAVRYFLAEIWPTIHGALPECQFSIVGADAPADLLAGAPGNVQWLGHLPDAGPWFESLRLSVAPLRFGAGAKGKIASSLAAGLPCVATGIAAEGMALVPEHGVLTAGDAASFAGAVIRLYGDAALWEQLSNGAIAYASTTLSIGKWRQDLDMMLQRIGI